MDDTDNVDRLAGEGVALEIAGHHLTARFTMRSLKDLQKEHGSIQDIGEMLRLLADPSKNTGPGAVPLYGTVASLLALALRYERIGDQPVTEEWILDNADPRRIIGYEQAVIRALNLAMPGAADDTADPTPPATPEETTASVETGFPGDLSSGSASPTAESAPPSSGTA